VQIAERFSFRANRLTVIVAADLGSCTQRIRTQGFSYRMIRSALIALLGSVVLLSTHAAVGATSPVGYPSVAKCTATQPPLDTGTDPGFPGKWWDPNHYGTGWDFYFTTGNATQIVMFWLTFDANRRPIWLTNGSSNYQVASDGSTQFWGTLDQVNIVPSTWQRTDSIAGNFAVTFAKGSTTVAAVSWQWNAAGTTIHKDQCIYDYFHGSTPAPTGALAISEGYTGNWFDPNHSGWGLDINIGAYSSTTSKEVDNPLIYDIAGNPVWLRGKVSNAPTTATTLTLDYVTSSYAGGIPTGTCTQTGNCTQTCSGIGSFTRAFTDSQNGTATVSANVNAQTPNNCTLPSTIIAWPPVPPLPSSNEPIAKLTDNYYYVSVNQTNCVIPTGQTTCPVEVSWASTSSTSRVFRRDLTDDTVSTTAISTSSSGQKTDQLAAGADVQYEMYKSGTAVGTPDYVSAEVVVPAAQSSTTPVSATPKVTAAPATDSVSDKVGATLAEFRVDEGGNSTYSIPIQVPPGTAGVVPKLSLAYNSRLGNGVMGPGWTISGGSQITRCRQTRENGDIGATAADATMPVDFTAGDDRFCLDGVRLFMTSVGVYGANGTAYFPENDPTTRVQAYSSNTSSSPPPAAGPDYFMVWRKDGTVSTYGYTSAVSANNARVSAILPSTGATVYVNWNLARVQDSAGNYIDYKYTNQPAGSSLPFSSGAVEYVLAQVSYTGHATAPVSSPYATVTFNYTTLTSSPRLGYQAGIAFLQSQQLASVSVANGATTMRYYKLAYQTSVSGSGLQQLSSVTECRDSTLGVCYPATTFAWSQAKYGLDSGTTTQSTPGGTNFYGLVGYKIADIDGDGRQDFVWAINDGKCNVGGTVHSSIYVEFADRDASSQLTLTPLGASGQTQAQTCAPIDLSGNDRAWYLTDYDGDGRADLMIGGAPGSNWAIYAGKGRPTIAGAAAFGTTNLLAGLGSPIPVASTLTAPVGILTDINGDGLPDFIYPVVADSNSGIADIMARVTVRQANGSLGFSDPYRVNFNLITDPTCDSALTCGPSFNVFYNDAAHHSALATDINGDGRADLTFIVDWAADSPCTTCAPTKSRFDPSVGHGKPAPTATTANGSGRYWYQFTVKSVAPPNGATLGTITLQEYWSQRSSSAGGTLPDNMDQVYVVDLNGDGLADILYQDSTTMSTFHALIDNGAGYEAPIDLLNVQNGKLLQFADLNGDGKLDILYAVGADMTASPSSNVTWSYVNVTLNSSGVWTFSTPVSLSTPVTNGQWTSLFADIDGDGATDFLKIYRYTSSSTNNLYTTRPIAGSRYQPRDVITTFTNGLGATTNISYQPLTNNGVYQRTGATTSSPGWGYGSPVFDVLAPMYVVSSASSSAPVYGSSAAMSTVYYRYEDARMQAGGRGFLGFRSVWSFDGNDEAATSQFVVTHTIYNQSFPFIGTPQSTTKTVVGGALTRGNSTLNSCAVSGPESVAGCFAPLGAANWPALGGIAVSQSLSIASCSGNGCTTPSATQCSATTPGPVSPLSEPGTFAAPTSPRPLFVFTSATSDTQYDLASAGATSTTKSFFCYSTDGYTNLNASSTFTLDGSGNTVAQKTLSNTYYNNLTQWYLGRLLESVVTFARPGLVAPDSPITRKTDYCYDLAQNATDSTLISYGCNTVPTTGLYTGLLLEEHIQKGVSGANDNEDMRTIYSLDAYGNRIAAYQCSADLTDPQCVSSVGASQQQSGTTVHRYAKTTYDSIGRYSTSSLLPFYSSSAAANVGEAAAITINSRDEFGNATSQISADGLTQTTEAGKLGHPYFVGDNTGKASTTTFRLCTSGSCPSDAKFRSQTISAGGASTWTWFDVLGRPILKASETFDADPAGQAFTGVCSYYDSHNRPIRQSQPFFLPATAAADGSPSLSSTTPCNSRASVVNTYDVLGRVTKIANPDNGFINKSYSGLTTTLSNPRNSAWLTTEIRNALGEIVSTQDPAGTNMGLLVTNDYDAAGNLRHMTRNAGNGNIVTEIRYDALGRKLKVIDPDAGTTTFAYNVTGDVITQTDAKGQTVTQKFDAMGRRWQRATSDGITDSWTYDAVSGACSTGHSCGQVVYESRSGTGLTAFSRTLAYDTYGRLYQRSTSFGGHTYLETTAYDQYGRVAAQQDASGYSLMPEYTPSGFVGKQLDTHIGAVYQILGTDRFGKITDDERGGNSAMLSHMSYDSMGRISTVCAGPTSTNCSLQDLGYVFDLAGNLATRTRTRTTSPTIESFTNDALNRLTAANLTVVNGVTQSAPIATATLSYDALGNLCSKSGTAYTYGSLSGCANRSSTASPHAVTAVGTTTYSYDADGNQTTNTAGRTLVYNALNQLTKASAGTTSSTFQYTPEGERFLRADTSGSTTTTYSILGNVEILSGATSETRRYLSGVAVDYIRAMNSETRYLFTDHLGSLDIVADATGKILERVSFDVHGSLRNPTSWTGTGAAPTSTNTGYSGHEEVYSLNLTHMNGRIYDPVLGRMLQADPMTGPGNQSLNRYSYVVNNPLSLTDPTGYSWWGDVLKIAAVAVISYFSFGVLAPAAAAYFGGGIAGAVLGGAVAGAVAGFASGVIMTGTLQGGLQGAFSGAVFGAVGGYFGGGFSLPKVAASATAGGVVSSLEGGKFGSGFLSAGLGSALMPTIDGINQGVVRYTAAALVGGTASVIAGGKFANGAETAVFQIAAESMLERSSTPPQASYADGTSPANPDLAQKMMAALNFKLLVSGAYFQTYDDDVTAATVWGKYAEEVEVEFNQQAELAAALIPVDDGYRIGAAYSTGSYDNASGFDIQHGWSWVHTHPEFIAYGAQFSPPEAYLDTGVLYAGRGGDLTTSYNYQANAFVVIPGGAIFGWNYNAFTQLANSNIGRTFLTQGEQRVH